MLSDAKNWLRENNSIFLNQSFVQIYYPRDLDKKMAIEVVQQATERGIGDKRDAILLLGIAQDAVTFINAIRGDNISATIYFNEPDALVFKSAAQSGVPITGVHVISVYWPENAVVNSFRPNFTRAFN